MNNVQELLNEEPMQEQVELEQEVLEEQVELELGELLDEEVMDEKVMEEVMVEEVMVEEKVEEPCLVVVKHDDAYADCGCNDNELRYKMIKKPVEQLDDATLLFNFCDKNLEDKFRTVIKENHILPLETTKKVIELKLKKNNDKCRESIKNTINDTFMSYYPEKILKFVNDTVNLLFLERMKSMDREFTCVHEGTYYTIHMNSEYKKVLFGTSYNLVKINMSTVKFE